MYSSGREVMSAHDVTQTLVWRGWMRGWIDYAIPKQEDKR